MDTAAETLIVVTVVTPTGGFAMTFDMADLPIARYHAMHWEREYGYGSVTMEGI